MVLLQFETDKTKEKTVDGQMKMKILTHPFCVSHSEPHGAEPRNRESSGKVGERLLRENLGKASRARIRSDAMRCFFRFQCVGGPLFGSYDDVGRFSGANEGSSSSIEHIISIPNAMLLELQWALLLHRAMCEWIGQLVST